MLRVAICERKQEYRFQLAALLEATVKPLACEIESFCCAEELLRCLSGDYAPDVAVLGISSDSERAISLAEKLNLLVPACRIIFVSDELRFATEVYRADHVWFLLRSELSERIVPAMRKALSSIEAYRSHGIVIRSRGKVTVVPLDEVLYLERDGRHTIIRTEKESFTSSEPPSRLLKNALARSFIHSHRSYWVNKDKIGSLAHDDFVLVNGELVPISRSRRAAAREDFISLSEK